MTASMAPAPRALDHDAFVYSSDEEYTATLAPLVQAALDTGNEVFVVVSPEKETLLRRGLGSAADVVSWFDAVERYRHPVKTLAGYDAILRALPSGTPAFVVGEVEFGGDERSWREWTRYESIANAVLQHYPARVICPYDERSLPAAVIEQVARTHHHVVAGGERRLSNEYVGPMTCVHDLAIRPTLPSRAPDVMLDEDLTPLTARRAFVAAVGLSRVEDLRIAELSLGVTEIVTNAFLHGALPARFRLWLEPDRVVCAVEDSGVRPHDPLLGFWPRRAEAGGMGLWLTRQMFDHVELDASELGGLLVCLEAGFGGEPGR